MLARQCLEQGVVIPLDKPFGWSSFDAVKYVKRQILQRFGMQKVKIGHAGTLDPLATGVLLLCVGRATQRVQELQEGRKTYTAVLRLGVVTPSYDLETQIAARSPYEHISREQTEAVLQQFSGRQEQTPPAFSAKNVNGQRSYQLARNGIEAKLNANAVYIYRICLTKFDLPFVTIEVECSKGTYIRSLASDVGKRLGCGATLVYLRRTGSGTYSAADLRTIDNLFV